MHTDTDRYVAGQTAQQDHKDYFVTRRDEIVSPNLESVENVLTEHFTRSCQILTVFSRLTL